jgi:xylulokinase
VIILSLLGVDIGTTGLKAIIFSYEGKILSHAYKEYILIHPRSGWVEINPNQLWDSVVYVIRQAVKNNETKDEVVAMSVSSMGEVACPVDKNGNLLYNAIIHMDRRGENQAEWIKNEFGRNKIFKITGMPVHAMYSICKLLWLKDKEPDIYKNIHKYLLLEDYIFFKLGLQPLIDYSLASRTMAFNVIKKEWSQEILDFCELDKNIFSDVVESGSIVGELKSKAASNLGLKKGVVVVAGAHDQIAGALGCGIIKDNIAMNATGTVESLVVSINKPKLSNELLANNMSCYCHAYQEMYVLVSFVFSAGSILRWYRDNFGLLEIQKGRRSGVDPYELILKQIDNNPSKVMILPHFYGSGCPYMDSRSKGAIVGLTLSTTKEEIVKAILEGICYEMKISIDLMKKSGIKINELRGTGGGARSEKWLQLKADIYNLPISITNNTETPCLGLAMLAGKGKGIYNSLNEASEILIKKKNTFFPNRKMNEQFMERMKVYSKLYSSLKDINYQL